MTFVRVRVRAVFLLCALEFAGCAAAHAAVEPAAAPGVLYMSPGRLGAIVAALMALTGVVMGGRALIRGPMGTGNGRRGAISALAAGLSGLALGGLVAATAPAGIGTGNGLGGAILAMVVGLIGMSLGGLALARARRAAG